MALGTPGGLKMKPMARNLFVLSLSVLTVGSFGCQSRDRLNVESFNQVNQHSTTQDDVVAMLGEPNHRLPGLWIYSRPNQHLYVKIEFDDAGRVTRKEWIDGTAEVWKDSAD